MNLLGFLVGLGFGVVLAAARLNDYTVIHNMLLLQDAQPYLIMASAVMVAAPLLHVLHRRGWQTPFAGPLVIRRGTPEARHLLGGTVFGAGWAVTGTCPGTALAMAGGGGVLGLCVMAGLVAGIAAREAAPARASVAAPAAAARPIPGL
jgi:uncharacterized membrane protein YedE/YeeE